MEVICACQAKKDGIFFPNKFIFITTDAATTFFLNVVFLNIYLVQIQISHLF